MISTETIAAIATAPGRGGVAVIRISGPDAFAVAARLAGKLPAPGRFAFRRLESTTLLDEALVLSFKAPHSYTGEDVVEFQCHGGSVTPRRVLEACLAAGARIARRGEFTERAFLNGRLDYDQAESVLDLIDAKTERAAAAALAGLTGDRKRTLQARYDELLALSSKVEHALDIEEGELPEEFVLGLERELDQVRSALTVTLRELKEGKLLREGALVVLAGPPNAGKSSLLNALLGENRAIVSPIAGTTRDSIEAWVDLEGWPVRLVDTAGLRATEDEIEGEGVRRAEALIAEADVVVRLVPPEAAEGELRPVAAQELAVRSKADLPGRAAPGELAISVKTGAGIAALKAAIVARLEAKAAVSDDLGSDPDAAIGALLASRAALPPSMADLVLAGNALAQAADLIGKPLGAVYSEDLLTALFSRFCVGK